MIRVRFRNRLSSGWDKVLFGAAWLGGTSVLLVLKSLRAPDLVIITWTACLIVAYAITLWVSPRFKVREDRAGDSCYYLGFLLTLSGLAYALWEFPREKNLDLVIQNFAIALTSTILGLGARVVFQQFRDEPVEVEQDVRLELSEAASRLKTEILQAVEDFSTLRTAVGQELRNEFAVSVRQIGKDSADAVAVATSQHSEATRAALASITAAAESMKTEVAAIRTSSRRMSDAFVRLGEKLDAAELPTQPFERELQRLITFIGNAVETLSTKLEASELPTTRFEQQLKRLTSVIEGTVEKEAARLQEHERGLEEVSKTAAYTRRIMQEVTSQAADVAQSLQSLSVSIAAMGTTLGEWNRDLSAGTSSWRAANEAERKAIEAQMELIEQSRQGLSRLEKALQSAVMESEAAVVKTQRSLASLADAIVERV